MKWKTRKVNHRCAAQPLAALVRDELDETECKRLATHLDTCTMCQQRLTTLAADSQWWLDASRWLDPTASEWEDCHGVVEDDDVAGNDFGDHDEYHSNAEHALLASGLLVATEKAGLLGTLGRYDVQSVIGAGGTGIVLKALDTELNRTVAIKVLSPPLASSGAARRRFAREGKAVAAVAHENVVTVHQVEGNGHLPYLVMQYIDGDSLQELVGRDGPLDVTTALRMTAQIAAALSAAHAQGLVHRDVKPANILVGAAGQRVWITDFGLARAVDDASLTRTGFIAGTPHYMSPEQSRGEAVRASSDLFGLGSVLYFILTGRPPFRAERTLAILNRICNEPHRPVREVNPDVPHAIADLVDRLLSKSAADRIADAATVQAYCLHLLAALAEPEGGTDGIRFELDPPNLDIMPVEPASNRGHLRRGLWAVSVVILVGLGVTVSTYVIQTSLDATDRSTLSHAGTVTRNEAVAVARGNDLIAFASSAFAAEEPSFAASDNGGAFAVVPPHAEMNTTSGFLTANVLAATPVNAPPPATPGRTFASPRLDADRITPPLISARDTGLIDVESLTWASTFDELRASLEAFETQIDHPPTAASHNGPPAPRLGRDSFAEQLDRMVNVLRALELRPATVNSHGPGTHHLRTDSVATPPTPGG